MTVTSTLRDVLLRRRLNLLLPARTFERLKRLQVILGASSLTEVVRTSLLLLEVCAEHVAWGGKLKVFRDGQLIDLPIAFDIATAALPVEQTREQTRAAVATLKDRRQASAREERSVVASSVKRSDVRNEETGPKNNSPARARA